MSRPVLSAAMAAIAAVGAALTLVPVAARAAIDRGIPVLIAEVGSTSLPDLTSSSDVRGLVGAGDGGASLLVASTPGDPLHDLTASLGGTDRRPPAIVTVRAASLDHLPAVLTPILLAVVEEPALLGAPVPTSDRVLVLIVTTPPAGDPERLGAAVRVAGSADAMLDALEAGAGAPSIARTLTSDSTRRGGVVTSADVATTATTTAGVGGLAEVPSGGLIRVVDEPPPVGLYVRYLQQRRLIVPVGVAAGLYALAAGLLGLVVLFGGRGATPRLRSVAAWAPLSVVPLAGGLMLVGHMDRLTYPVVVAFLAGVTILAVVALVAVERSRGPLAALATLGAAMLAMFVVEAAMGWTAAITPLLGGAQLDGGRFFGLPNVQIGLLMGACLYVAQRLPSAAAGVALILGAALFAGLPWTGSNLGAAVALAAAAGVWWGLRADAGRLRPITAARVLATVGGTVAIVVIAHRYLTDAPTHVSRFASDAGGIPGIWQRFVDRLGVGMDLIARNPFGVIPVAGVLVTLWLVLRPPEALRPSLAEHPAWRDAAVTILLGSVVAYVANDSGAAALGLGFGTALGGILHVSLAEPPSKMGGP